MKNTENSVIAYPSWQAGGNVWYSVCLITLYNLTDNDIVAPEISFDVDASQTISVDTNFTFSRSVNTITGYLGEGNTIPAQGSVLFSIGVGNNSGTTIGNLPSNFFVNGQDANPPVDNEAPTTPKNIQATAIGSQTLSLVWDASTDNVMVAGYQVSYGVQGLAPNILTVTTNSINLNALTPETTWSITVSAYDLAGNYSAMSPPFVVHTLPALPDPGAWTFSCAPFIDYTAWPTPQCSVYGQDTNIRSYVLGFLTAGQTDNGIKPCWGGLASVTDSQTETLHDGDATVSDYGKDDISAFRTMGGDIAISFGGAAGTLIEAEISDIPMLVSLYQGVIDNYQLTHIDFDFEGEVLQESDIMQRHTCAIVQVQMSNPALQLSYTLPVDGQTDPASQGLTSFGVAFIKMLADAGLRPALINGMTMDFGPTAPPPDVYQGCVLALNMLNAQITTAFPLWSSSQAWRRMGATPMFGYNDNGTDFTPDNQRQLVDFATTNNLGCLSGWDATRDYNQGLSMCQTSEHTNLYACTYEGDESYTYSKIIVGYTHS